MKARSLREFADVSPTWVQTDPLRRSYELRAGDVVVATLHWTHPWGSLATGETGEGHWTLKRTGFLRPRVIARVRGADTDAAVVAMHPGGSGEVTLADGHQFRWTPMNLWRSEWAFTTNEGTRLIVFKPNLALARTEAEVKVEQHALALPDLSLLTLLGWYLLILTHEETAAAGIP